MSRSTIALSLICLVLAIGIPPLLSPSAIGILSQMLIGSLFAIAYGLLSGQAGLLSFGHAAFFGVGAFAAIHGMAGVDAKTLSIPMPLIPVLSAVIGFIVGIVAGYFATLRTGIYFSMITLALAELIYSLAPALEPIFGGEGGMSASRFPWLGISFYTDLQNYYLVLFWVVASGMLLYFFTFTPLGRVAVALRENEKRVAFLGYNVHVTKVLVFGISAMVSAVAGGLWAITLERSNYTVFGLETSANVVLSAFIGGASTFLGPAVGAISLTLFQTVVSDYSRQWLLYEGLIFVLVMMYAPEGLVSLFRRKLDEFVRGGMSEKANVILGALLALFIGMFGYMAIEAVAAELGGSRGGISGRLPWLLVMAALIAACTVIKSRASIGGRRISPKPVESLADQ